MRIQTYAFIKMSTQQLQKIRYDIAVKYGYVPYSKEMRVMSKEDAKTYLEVNKVLTERFGDDVV